MQNAVTELRSRRKELKSIIIALDVRGKELESIAVSSDTRVKELEGILTECNMNECCGNVTNRSYIDLVKLQIT